MSPDEFVEKVFASGVIARPKPVAYGEQVSPHLKVGVDQLASPDIGQMTLLPQSVALYEAAREILGQPIRVNAGWRTVAHELALQDAGYRTAKWISPHCLGAALDLQLGLGAVGQPERNAELQEALKSAATKLQFPAPRLGHFAYSEHFTHVDLVFFLFKPYTELDHPGAWTELDPGVRQQLGNSWQPGISW
jgi:hypothetical protein